MEADSSRLRDPSSARVSSARVTGRCGAPALEPHPGGGKDADRDRCAGAGTRAVDRVQRYIERLAMRGPDRGRRRKRARGRHGDPGTRGGHLPREPEAVLLLQRARLHSGRVPRGHRPLRRSVGRPLPGLPALVHVALIEGSLPGCEGLHLEGECERVIVVVERQRIDRRRPLPDVNEHRRTRRSPRGWGLDGAESGARPVTERRPEQRSPLASWVERIERVERVERIERIDATRRRLSRSAAAAVSVSVTNRGRVGSTGRRAVTAGRSCPGSTSLPWRRAGSAPRTRGRCTPASPVR